MGVYLCTSPSLDHVESNVSWNDIDYDTVAQELGDYTSEVGFKEEVLRVLTDIGMLDVKTLAELEFRVEVEDVTGDDEEEEEVVNEEVEVEREGSVETSSD